MRTITFSAVAFLAVAALAHGQDKTPKPAAPATAPAPTPENVSYAIGTMIAGNLKEQGIKVDLAELSKGISDVLDGKEPRLDKTQCQQIMMAFQKAQMKGQASGQEAAQKERTAQSKTSYDKALAAGDKNAVASNDFLKTNGKRKGVTTTASGLQYEVLKAGDGSKPTSADTVKVHYHGTLPDGTVFDSSVQRGEPISFPLLGVIPGWTEGVQLMPVGSKYKFSIPSYLSYGDTGSPPKIPGHSALVFEVELLAIE